MRSPYTLEDPPPIEPPDRVVEATAWSVAADLWHTHRPDTLLGTDCVRCQHGWPCPTWEVADSILGDVCAAVPAVPQPAAAVAEHPVPPGRHATGHPVPVPQPKPQPNTAEPKTPQSKPPQSTPSQSRPHTADTPAARRRRRAADPAEAQTDVLPAIGATPPPA